jgi:hypothetical protein
MNSIGRVLSLAGGFFTGAGSHVRRLLRGGHDDLGVPIFLAISFMASPVSFR